MSVDIRIIGVPERMDNIMQTKELLNVKDENIFIDEYHLGLLQNAGKAWLKPTDATHVMVLQDDIILCNSFLYYCEKIVSMFGELIISLFPIQFINRKVVGRLPIQSPYILTNELSGCGIIMKREYIYPCVLSWSDELYGDDVNIQAWAKRNLIGIITTIPSLIQHIGIQSVFDNSRSIGSFWDFREDPSEVDWDNKYVTNWANIIKR